MAGTLRYFTKINMSSLTSNVTRQFIVNNTRLLYSEASLGMVDYRKTRELFRKQYLSGINEFHAKIKNSISVQSEMIFTEDLKAMLHLIEKIPDDIELLKSMLQKYNSQNNEMRFSDFKFGPIVMRTLYYLNEPDTAKELFLNQDYQNFFRQHSTYMILLDLLYENERYQDIIEVYDQMRTIFVNGINHSKLAINVVAMACLKLNTPESLQYCLKICKELSEQSTSPLRRFISILGALALNQNRPEIALELLILCTNPNYIAIASIKIMALVDLNKFNDVKRMLEHILNFQPSIVSITSDTLERIETALDKQNPEVASQIQSLLTVLKNGGYVSTMTLLEHLSVPIQTGRFMKRTIHRDQGWTGRPVDFGKGNTFSNNKKRHNFTYERNQYNSG